MRTMATAVLLFLLVPQSAFSQQSQAVWGMTVGDRFVTKQSHQRTTKLIIEDRPETIVRSLDQLLLSYTAMAVDADGTAHLTVEILQAMRENESNTALPDTDEVFAALNGLRVMIRVEPDGHVAPESPETHRAFLQQLSRGDRRFLTFLKQACPPETFTAWFGRPFLMAGLKSDARNDDTWEATLTESAGNWGQLSAELRIQPLQESGNNRERSITGNCTFAPLVLPEQSGASTEQAELPISGLTVTATSVVGRVMVMDFRARLNRAPFQELNVSTTLSGEAALDESASRRMGYATVRIEQQHDCSVSMLRFQVNNGSELPVPPAEAVQPVPQ